MATFCGRRRANWAARSAFPSRCTIIADTSPAICYRTCVPNPDKLPEFTAWCAKHISGDEKGEAQIFLDHLFQAFGHTGRLKEAGATLEWRVNKDDGGTSFADLGRR